MAPNLTKEAVATDWHLKSPTKIPAWTEAFALHCIRSNAGKDIRPHSHGR